MNQLLTIKATIQIAKPISEVFEAIVDPQKMSNYFIERGSARMEQGKDVQWKWPEFDMQATVNVVEIKINELVSFQWEGVKDKKTSVKISLSSAGDNATVVSVTEGDLENNEEGIKWLIGNTEGWANFLACMKAYLEYGINLRKGAFDFMKKSS